ALFGLWWRRDRFRTSPGAWLLLAVILAMAVALWRLAVVMGYLSERHALLLVLCGCFWSAAGLEEMGRRVGGVGGRGAAERGRQGEWPSLASRADYWQWAGVGDGPAPGAGRGGAAEDAGAASRQPGRAAAGGAVAGRARRPRRRGRRSVLLVALLRRVCLPRI